MKIISAEEARKTAESVTGVLSEQEVMRRIDVEIQSGNLYLRLSTKENISEEVQKYFTDLGYKLSYERAPYSEGKAWVIFW